MLSSELGSLLHLASPTLPIGGFSYSQGLESAISNGLINNAQQAKRWIQDHLEGVIANSEAVVWVYLYHAWRAKDVNQIAKWNTWFWASRETSEFRNETEQMGWSLFKLIQDLGWAEQNDLTIFESIKPITLPCAHAFVCQHKNIQVRNGVHIYLFAWLENQVISAMKAIPLGQVAGQKILTELSQTLTNLLEGIIEKSQADDFSLNTFSMQLSILSSRHENQYSRLFRS